MYDKRNCKIRKVFTKNIDNFEGKVVKLFKKLKKHLYWDRNCAILTSRQTKVFEMSQSFQAPFFV